MCGFGASNGVLWRLEISVLWKNGMSIHPKRYGIYVEGLWKSNCMARVVNRHLGFVYAKWCISTSLISLTCWWVGRDNVQGRIQREWMGVEKVVYAIRFQLLVSFRIGFNTCGCRAVRLFSRYFTHSQIYI